MSRAVELQEERDLARWRAERRLFADLIAFVRARAPRCSHPACRAPAYWRWSTPRAESGFPRDELACDAHKRDGSVEITGSSVLRRVFAWPC